MESGELIAVGKIGRPVGLRGECRLFLLGDALKGLSLPVKLLAKSDSGNSQKEFEIVSLKGTESPYRAVISGYESRESVDSIKNYTLYIPMSELPNAGDDEYYFFQLKGLEVITSSGRVIGTVAEVYNFPTTDAIEVRKKSGSLAMIPFRKEIVQSVSLDEKRLVIVDDALQDIL